MISFHIRVLRWFYRMSRVPSYVLAERGCLHFPYLSNSTLVVVGLGRILNKNEERVILKYREVAHHFADIMFVRIFGCGICLY